MQKRVLYLVIAPALICLVLAGLVGYQRTALAQTRAPATANIKVQVIKACQDCDLPPSPGPCRTTVFHRDQAATWMPDRSVKIIGVSIPEQSEITLYTDIEVTTAPVMYLPQGHIFRVKYAGPGILRNPPCEASFSGSNITTTNIVFPSGYGIAIGSGTPVYVHMDVINWAPYEINPMAQDVYVYYVDGSG